MSPEYALDGVFSVKSDVFSFGVLVLEILSGRRNTGVFKTGTLNLLAYVSCANCFSPQFFLVCSPFATDINLKHSGMEIVDRRQGTGFHGRDANWKL